MQRIRVDPQRWAQINELLDAALDLPVAAREQWLQALAPEYADLTPELRDLLSRAANVETNDFLSALPPLDAPAQVGEHEGELVGAYRLVRELGVGGMGSVWLAERTDQLIKRPVALKLPHLLTHRAGLAERMVRERDILASLDHPNIARLFDAGLTAEGRPYLALEFIEGQSIDVFCAQRQLTIPERLRLFLQVAKAVAYAHGKLVLHRDLKPANILVTAEGNVRLLDFGVAKLLSEGSAHSTELTELSGRAMTLDYASPEQITGEPMTVAADVYSLGVVLFELLAGARPYSLKRGSRGALEEAILSVDPPAPSRVASGADTKLLKGDLDCVVLKALKKQPEERYPSVSALADDIERYLDVRPVLARPDHWTYRLRKFSHRHRVAIASAALVLTAIIAAAVIALWQARVAVAESERAAQANKLLTSFFADADPYGPAGSAPSAIDLLVQAHQRVLADTTMDPDRRLELLTTIAYSLNNFQDVKRAESVISAAIEESRGKLPEDHPQLLHARAVQALTRRFASDPEQLRRDVDRLLPLLRGNDVAVPEDLPSVLETSVFIAKLQNRLPDAEREAQEGFVIARDRFGDTHPLTLQMKWGVVDVYRQQRRDADALALARETMPQTLAAYAQTPRHPHVIEAQEVYGRVLMRAGHVRAGIESVSQAFQGAQETFGPTGVAVCYFGSNLGVQLLLTRELARARDVLDKALNACRVAPGPSSPAFAITQHILAAVHNAARHPKLALDAIAAAAPVLDKDPSLHADRAVALALQGDVAAAEAAMALATSNNASPDWELVHRRGIVEHAAGRYAEAARLQEEAYALIADGPLAGYRRAIVLMQSAICYLQAGDTTHAKERAQSAITLAASLQLEPSPGLADAWSVLARILLDANDPWAASELLERADAFWRSFDAENRFAGETALWLGRAYRALGRHREANETLRRAAAVLARSPMAADRALAKTAR